MSPVPTGRAPKPENPKSSMENLREAVFGLPIRFTLEQQRRIDEEPGPRELLSHKLQHRLRGDRARYLKQDLENLKRGDWLAAGLFWAFRFADMQRIRKDYKGIELDLN